MRRLSVCLFVAALLLAATGCEGLQLAWRYPTGGRIRSEPAVGPDGTSYALSDDGFLYAFAPDGKTKWASNLGGLVTDSLSVGPDGTVYAGLLSDRIIAVNRNGGILWRFEASSSLLGNPAIADDGTLFVGTSGGTLYTLSVTGTLEWKITLPAKMTSAPVLDAQETVFLGGADRRLYALTRWGRFEWSLPLDGIPHSVAVGAGDAVYVLLSDGSLVKVSASGNVEWSYRVGSGAFGPLVGNGRIFVAGRGGTIAALDPSGRLLWRRAVGGRLFGSWLLGRRGIYVMKMTSELEEIDATSGKTLSLTKVDSEGTLGMQPAGNILIGGRDWLVYGYSGAQADPEAAWGTTSGDARHSGHGRGRFDERAAQRLLSRIPDYLALSAQIDTTSRYALDGLLREVKRRIDSGDVGKSTWYVRRLLERIVGTGTLNPIIEGNRVVNDFPEIRSRAARLLGRLGSLGVRAELIRALGQESDPVAAAAEIEALGSIGSDSDGASTRAIAAAVRRFAVSSGPQPRIALAAIGALADIFRYEGGVSDPAARALLLDLLRGSYPTTVRDAALSLLLENHP